VSVVDPQVFGDFFSFREQFLKNGSEDDRNYELRERLKPVCTRTLRKQVLEYIRFTQRIPLTQDFLPSDDEQRLYDLVSSYLQRDILFALPASQRSLLTLVLRKLLASSTFAIAGTLHSLIHRLQAKDAAESALNEEDFEAIDELADEWEGEDSPELDLEHSPIFSGRNWRSCSGTRASPTPSGATPRATPCSPCWRPRWRRRWRSVRRAKRS